MFAATTVGTLYHRRLALTGPYPRQ